MPRKQAPIAEELLDLQRRLAEWRSSHPRRSPLPDEFWTEADGLARKHGLYRTARTLPIDISGIRMASDPLTATARGALIAAMYEK